MKLEVGMSEELKLLFEDLHKNELSKVGKCNLELEIRNLLAQLQAYKDKEDKLREYIDKHYLWEYIKELDQYVTCEEDIKQILNEGDK